MYSDQLMKYGFIPANHEKPVWFPVKIGDVYDQRGAVVPSYKRVYRDDSGDTLAVHSDKYRLISYETSFNAFDRALGVSGLNLDDLHVCTDLTHNGARCFRQYVLPHHKVDLNGGTTVLRIIMFNSYDGSTMFSGMAGGYSFVCANTSVVGHDLVRVGVKHIGSHNDNRIETTIANLVASAAKAMQKMENMREWSQKWPGADHVNKALEAFPQGSERFTDMMLSRYTLNADKSLWGVYNILTAWSSHDDRDKANNAALRAKREQRVGQFIECDEWKVLENVT